MKITIIIEDDSKLLIRDLTEPQKPHNPHLVEDERWRDEDTYHGYLVSRFVKPLSHQS